MRVRLIDNIDEFLKLEPYWNNVLHDSNVDYPFLTFEWVSSWWKSFGYGKELMVLTAHNDENSPPHGIAPLMIEKIAGIRIIKFIGTGRSDFLDFIIKDDSEETKRAFFNFLQAKRKSWDLILLSDILMDEANVKKMNDEAKRSGWRMDRRLYYYSPYLAIKISWPNYLSSKSRNFRHNLKREAIGLQKAGLKLVIRQLDSRHFERFFSDLVEIEKNSWKNDAGTPNMQDIQSERFYINFLKKFAERNWLNVWIGILNDAPAAYLIAFDYQEKIWFYNIAYRKEFKKYGIGSILFHHAIKAAFSLKKSECNFMRSSQAYKERWASQRRESYQLVFFKKSVRSLLAYLFLIRLRWILSRNRTIRQVRLQLIVTLNNLKKTVSWPAKIEHEV